VAPAVTQPARRADNCSSTDAAQLKKEKYEKLLDENYTRAKTTVWSSWYDSEIRGWLVGHGYLKSDAEAKRDEVGLTNKAGESGDLLQLVNLMSSKYKETTAAPYLAWPDARLRAQLRSYGIDDTKFTSRPSLLHEVRSESSAAWKENSADRQSTTSRARTRLSRSSPPSESTLAAASSLPRRSSPAFSSS